MTMWQVRVYFAEDKKLGGAKQKISGTSAMRAWRRERAAMKKAGLS